MPNLKLMQWLTSGHFHFIFSNLSGLQVTETIESKIDKRGLLNTEAQIYVLKRWASFLSLRVVSLGFTQLVEWFNSSLLSLADR